MLIQKIDPVSIDKKIAVMQDRLYSSLVDQFGDTWLCYPRCYRNRRKDSNGAYYTAEHVVTKTDYKSVLFNDNVNMLSFFLKDDTVEETSNGIITSKVSVIFSCNLNNLFPTVPHRADEELKVLINSVIGYGKFSRGWTLTSIEDGLDNVYKEFKRDNVEWSNIAPRHLVRFNFNVEYCLGCC